MYIKMCFNKANNKSLHFALVLLLYKDLHVLLERTKKLSQIKQRTFKNNFLKSKYYPERELP